jgi:hypothetical protein
MMLNAGQAILTQINEKEYAAPRVDAIKAILDAG